MFTGAIGCRQSLRDVADVNRLGYRATGTARCSSCVANLSASSSARASAAEENTLDPSIL